MNCPFCGEEMREGTIASYGFLVWFPAKHEIRLRDFFGYDAVKNPWKKVGGITLANRKTLRKWINQNPGWICPRCKKAVLDWEGTQVSYTRKI